jgi:hypothetical protein
VHSDITTSVEIQHNMICLNDKEYKSLSKKAVPGSRGPKVPSIHVPVEGDGDNTERVWLFQNPAMPYRTCTVKTSISDTKTREILKSDGNAFPQHGVRAFKAARLATSSALNGEAGGTTNPADDELKISSLPVLFEHAQKVNPEVCLHCMGHSSMYPTVQAL